MPRTNKRLKETRDTYILLMINNSIKTEDVAELFNISPQAVYDVTKRHKVQVEEETNN